MISQKLLRIFVSPHCT